MSDLGSSFFVVVMSKTQKTTLTLRNGQNESDRNSLEKLGIGMTAGTVVNLFLILIIVVGNVLVIAAYVKNRRLHTGTYALIVSLAFSDLLVGSASLPIRIYGLIMNWKVSVITMAFYVTVDIFSALVSNLHLMAISFERFVAVSRPFYHQTLSIKPYAFASTLSWILGIIVASSHPGNYLRNKDEQGLKLKILEVYSAVLFTVCFLGPLLIIIFVNIGIFRVARVLIHCAPSRNGSFKQRVRKERKAAFTLLVMTGFFFVAWTPFFVLNMFYVYCVQCLPSSSNVQYVMVDVMKWLHYSNSAINPAIYAFRDAEMRRTFARLLGPLGRLCRGGRVQPEFPNTQEVLDLHTRN